MTNVELRKNQLDALTDRANVLLGFFEHESILTMVRGAVRNIDDGRVWLKEQNIETRPTLMGIVDLNVKLADATLTQMEGVAQSHGKTAIAIG